MSKQARELAELMGWTHVEEPGMGGTLIYWLSPQDKSEKFPKYDTDRNAMREVHKVLHERGLWDEFLDCWHGGDLPFGAFNEYSAMWVFLNDLPGQVQAAIQVLKEDK